VVTSNQKQAQTADVNDPESWVALKLRYFTPREAANLHGFQQDFVFPSAITTRQRYQLIGNGLNVKVVSELLKYLIKS
jgi:tRNA (cytosine38-C5)-methyltransferase